MSKTYWDAITNEENHRVFRCVVGFDGYADKIAKVVKTRYSENDYEAFATIGEFGARLVSDAGLSGDFELVFCDTRAE